MDNSNWKLSGEDLIDKPVPPRRKPRTAEEIEQQREARDIQRYSILKKLWGITPKETKRRKFGKNKKTWDCSVTSGDSP